MARSWNSKRFRRHIGNDGRDEGDQNVRYRKSSNGSSLQVSKGKPFINQLNSKHCRVVRESNDKPTFRLHKERKKRL